MKSTRIEQVIRFDGVQFLRFFAASLVLISHASFIVQTRIDSSFPLWGGAVQGVAIFFVISGFVISITSRKLVGDSNGYKRFLLKRIIRIIPLYWTLNLLKIFGLLIMRSNIIANPDTTNIICSFLFIPSRDATGEIKTFYGVGWTINLEMLFYVTFAVALYVKVRPLYFTAAVLMVVGTLSIFRDDSWPAVTFFFHPLVFNFIWGLTIAEFSIRNVSIGSSVAATLVVIGSLLIFFPPQIYLFGLEYSAIVAGIVFLEPQIRDRLPRILVFGGDASYSLYLIHPMVSVFTAILLSMMGISNGLFYVVLIILICLSVASISYVYFERPITHYLKVKFNLVRFRMIDNSPGNK